jgi:hypothetical protein
MLLAKGTANQIVCHLVKAHSAEWLVGPQRIIFTLVNKQMGRVPGIRH